MKQKYTITVAGMDINIITEQSPEVVNNIVGTIDRRIREIYLRSPLCSRTESALLCAMDYCADKLTLTEKVKSLEAQLEELSKAEVLTKTIDFAEKDAELKELREKLQALTEQNSALQDEIDNLRNAVSEMETETERFAELERENNDLASENISMRKTVAEQEERIALLEAGINELTDSLCAKNENPEQTKEDKPLSAEETDKASPARIRVKRHSERSSEIVKPEQISIDGSDIPPVRQQVKRERRRPSAFDLISSDDI